MEAENDAIPTLLTEQRDNAPDDLQHYFLTFEDYWEKKLWHELTNLLIEFFDNEQSAPQRLPLFEKFVKTFAAKINQLKLVTLGLSAASQIPTDQDRLTFLTSLAESVNNDSSKDAHVYATTSVASVQLRLSQNDQALENLQSCEKTLDGFDSVEKVVHASFYRVYADYFSNKRDFAQFYRTTLLYLACIDLDTATTVQQRQALAYNLAIAALVSDQIYNFGEFLLHPILDSLADTPSSWLRDLLLAFNKGDLTTAYRLLGANMAKDDLLRSNEAFLYQKISLAALTETVFRRPPRDRAMSFATIASETSVRPDEIEHLLMKALSLGLLRGTIDQVAEIALINWVQPKVLEKSQIQGMRNRLTEWNQGVNKLGSWIEESGHDIWAV